jgi:hypothetical protein
LQGSCREFLKLRLPSGLGVQRSVIAMARMDSQTSSMLRRHDSYAPIVTVVLKISRPVGNEVTTANHIAKLVKGSVES